MVMVAEVVLHSTLIRSSLAVERTLYEAPYPAGTAVDEVRRWQVFVVWEKEIFVAKRKAVIQADSNIDKYIVFFMVLNA